MLCPGTNRARGVRGDGPTTIPTGLTARTTNPSLTPWPPHAAAAPSTGYAPPGRYDDRPVAITADQIDVARARQPPAASPPPLTSSLAAPRSTGHRNPTTRPRLSP